MGINWILQNILELLRFLGLYIMMLEKNFTHCWFWSAQDKFWLTLKLLMFCSNLLQLLHTVKIIDTMQWVYQWTSLETYYDSSWYFWCVKILYAWKRLRQHYYEHNMCTYRLTKVYMNPENKVYTKFGVYTFLLLGIWVCTEFTHGLHALSQHVNHEKTTSKLSFGSPQLWPNTPNLEMAISRQPMHRLGWANKQI